MYLLSRAWNLLRAEWSFALSHLGIVRLRSMPTFVSVEPAAICQLRCPQCPVGQHAGRSTHDGAMMLSMDMLVRIVDEVKRYAHTMQFYFQGEPLLNRDLPQMIRYAHEAGLYTIVSTNAQALTPDLARELVQAGLNRIIVSIDGFTEETYSAYRVGGSLDKALAGLRAMHDAKFTQRGLSLLCKSRTCIVLQVLRLRSNEHEWDWIRKHYRELGADRLEFKTAQFYDYELGNELMPTDERYARYRKGADGRYYPKNARKKSLFSQPCRRLWNGCVITTSGEVLPCCYDKVGAHAYGNVREQGLKDIYQGEKARRFRETVLRHGERVDICKNCLP